MTVETFLANFEQLAVAPNGIPKLRELILQLAVRGKLVPQDPNDEPASELLRRIQAEKQRLIADGAIRKPKPMPPIEPNECPYALPEGWTWARLAELGKWTVGSGFPKREQGHKDQPILFCKVSDMNSSGNEKWIKATENSIDAETAERIRANVHAPGTVVFPKIGGAIATNKRRILTVPTAIDNNCLGISPDEHCSTEWLYLLLRSIDFTKFQAGTSVPALSQSVIGLIVTGLAPLAEQKRIVAKVDELMALCDELEAKQHAKRTKQIALNRACLHALISPDGEGRAKAWHRLCNHFDDLYTVPETVAELRQTILQLAVMGRLVPQGPTDEPASELIKRIQAEKQRLVTEGQIRKGKSLQLIGSEERPHELPVGWEWVRLGEVGAINPRNTAFDDKMAGFVPMSLVFDAFGSYPQHEERPWGEIKKGYTHFADGDVVLAKITPCFENGKAGVMRGLPNGFGAGTTELHVVRPIRDHVVPEYVWIFFKSPRFREAGEAQMTGTAGQKRIPKAYVESSLLPLPPLAEQKRIVAKVDRLVALCDDLEAKLQQAQQDADHFLASIVYELIT